MSLFDKVLRMGEGKILRQLVTISRSVNAIEDEFVAMSDAELRAMTDEFKARLEKGETLDEIMPEAFATVREAAKRVLGQRHFDVQIEGGAALHLGNIAEMKTGEGKTLVSTLPAYLNALSGKGVHVVTVNDYLAQYHAEWMGRVHHFLGLTVGVIQPDLSKNERREAYACDVTYGTNNEFGFDYLRDNMANALEECVQRGHNFAIVDEADSMLIDEAVTPLIISTSTRTRRTAPLARASPRGTIWSTDFDYATDETSGRSRPSAGQHEVEDLMAWGGPSGKGKRREELVADARAPSGTASSATSSTSSGRQGSDHRRVHRPRDGGPVVAIATACTRRSRSRKA